VVKTGITVSEREKMESVSKGADGAFTVTTGKRTIRCSRVLPALGRRGTPRRLGVPGEEREKVAYRLVDPELYQHQHLLVVGGGDAAVEAAVSLAQQTGNRVTLSYRGAKLIRCREENLERLNQAISEQRITPLYESNVKAIDLDRVIVDHKGSEVTLANDYLFVFAGGELPTAVLENAGIKIKTHHGKRIVDKRAKAGRHATPPP
jgi:thioredoxin reductase